MVERTGAWCGGLAVLWLVACLVGCGGGSDAKQGDGKGSALPPSVATTPSSACATGTSVPCNCVDGASGVRSCQLDGTYSACTCGAGSGVAGGSSGVASAAGGASAATGMPTAGATGMAMGGAAAPPPDTTGVVMVPPEDVAACTGMGAPPSATEQVEVLEIHTDKVVYGGQEYPVVPGGFTSPSTTLYACFWVEFDMPEKHHIIGWEGAVGDRAVHHQQVSLGAKPFYLTAQGGLCGLPTVDFTWTGERPTEWTPALAGYPLGGPENGGKARFLWQTHFEGATTYSGGFKAYITKNLRKYDGGNFEQGDVAGISIPAMSQATHVSTCSPDATTMKLVHPIYVYASMEHAHLTIRHIKGEQKRGGQSIYTFGDEMTSGFAGFFDQSFHPHTPCVEILPGDEIVTTCDYDNTFPFEVVGGEATNQEMCTTFMQYFPRLPGTTNNFCGTIDSSGGFSP